MKVDAVRIRGAGEVDVLDLATIELREPGPDEIVVEVAAAGLNRADVLQRKGLYPAPPGVPPDVPGLEYAGTVLAVGGEVRTWQPGERVMGIVSGGAMARRVLVHEREALPVPEGMSLTDAAAIPEVFLTAWDALIAQARLRVGETVLLHAVASGVGTAALQIALVAGAHPLGTSRSPAKIDRCRDLGLVDGLVVGDGRFATWVHERTGGRGADVLLDTVGAAYLGENLKALAERGRMVVLGLMGGATGQLPLGLLLARRCTVTGSVLRARPLEEKAALAQAFTREALPLFEKGRLRPVVDDVMAMTEIREGHRRIEANETVGKIVMAWG